MYYVYQHKFVDTQEIFYIGKGCKKRAYSTYRNTRWKNLIQNREYVVEILEQGLTEEQAFNIEARLIEQLKPICNITPGGNTSGITSSEYQKEFYQSIQGIKKKKNLSIRMKENNPMFSEHKRDLQRQRNLGNKNFFHNLTPESKQKHSRNVSEAKKGSKNPRARKCIYVPTQVEYGSIGELIRENNLDRSLLFYVKRNLIKLL